MTKSQSLTIGVASAVGVLLANLVEPWVAAVLAVGGLLWLFVQQGQAEFRRALTTALAAFIAAAAVVFLLR